MIALFCYEKENPKTEEAVFDDVLSQHKHF